jgi:hypothetical protein
MKPSTRRLIGFLILTSLASAAALSGCSRVQLPAAQSGTTEEEARKELEQRLLRSEEVSAHISEIRKALQPIEAAFRDMGKIVGVRLSGYPGGVLSGLLDRLDHALRNAGKGLVQKYPDGTWTIERPSPMALAPGQQGACARSRVRVEGAKQSGSDTITVSMSECETPNQFERLAMILVRTNGDREVEIYTAALEGRRAETINVEPCHLRVEPKGESTLTCAPMVLESGKFRTDIEHLDVAVDARNLRADIRATIYYNDVIRARISLDPQHLIDDRIVCSRGEPCFQ